MRATASNGAPARGRPLSPHLTVYRMRRYCLLTSFSNRAAGGILSLGLPLFAYWLISLASGERWYESTHAVLGHPALLAFYALLLLAFAYHLIAGIRHLIWDTGRGLERAQSRTSAWVVIACSLVLAGLLIWWAMSRAGGPALPAAGASLSPAHAASIARAPA
ncbi:MAG TPA: succinate dehydrogenase, cytochrome b556 subunit [Steroidobacteraceae bacterium]|nr:succinate dehydrogenase, cytochrome b556 subunit [Steroidobacteraceae bacterium]